MKALHSLMKAGLSGMSPPPTPDHSQRSPEDIAHMESLKAEKKLMEAHRAEVKSALAKHDEAIAAIQIDLERVNGELQAGRAVGEDQGTELEALKAEAEQLQADLATANEGEFIANRNPSCMRADR